MHAPASLAVIPGGKCTLTPCHLQRDRKQHRQEVPVSQLGDAAASPACLPGARPERSGASSDSCTPTRHPRWERPGPRRLHVDLCVTPRPFLFHKYTNRRLSSSFCEAQNRTLGHGTNKLQRCLSQNKEKLDVLAKGALGLSFQGVHGRKGNPLAVPGPDHGVTTRVWVLPSQPCNEPSRKELPAGVIPASNSS